MPAIIGCVRACVCLPTYNERENLEPMVRALLERPRPDDRVLVIDDNSPDGTGELADRLAASSTASTCCTGREGGARARLPRRLPPGARRRGRLILEMDCDFSHDPDDVPRLIAAAEHADLVLGSRYVAAAAPRTGAPCAASSRAAGSLYAQVLLGLGDTRPDGGFKCYRRACSSASTSTRRLEGYAFQIETTYRALRAGFRVVEIPITFADREAGGSKMSRRIVLEAIWRVPLLRFQRLG